MSPYISKIFHLFLLGSFTLSIFSCGNETREEKRILVFSKTEGWRHESIPAGKEALIKLGAENNIKVDTTENAAYISEDSLKKYSAVVFLNTTMDILDHRQEIDFERYIQAGGGFVGIHSAADTEYNWPWYGKLVGAYFAGHPGDPNVRKGIVEIKDKTHPTTSFLPERWERNDEWYDYKSINPNINVLATLDTTSYEGGQHFGREHPIAWYHEFDGGRAFYTGGGHTNEAFSEPLFLQHLLEGIHYAIGEDKKLDYAKAHSLRVPEDNRFVQEVLDEFLDEPIQLAVTKEHKVYFIERRGNIKVYDPEEKATRIIATLAVNTTGNYEDGLLGMAIDPNFEKNRWIYFYYSPLGGAPRQYLSRFYLATGDSLIMNSEKVILEVPVQRETCCHSAGSIQFGPDGVLYLSTGDNTSSKESEGYSPLDERPGRAPFDAQKSSGNTNDLRGKILRIIPHKDGTYSIPEGNLFPKNTPDTRPEIYIMGARNPYRITIDAKTKTLYWGDVGPDAGKSSVQGSESFDEWNKATEAGNYGWPYFQANNIPFPRWDFETETPGPYYNPDAPVNESPNNTGLRELPPAKSSFIWYPYGNSREFPMLGTGSRSAMSGPVYYSDLYEKGKRFPEYYDGKLFIYEWARSWIKVITFDKDGEISRIEPFLPHIQVSKPIDMQFGPDGAMYVLQYGENYFARNPDARLVRIDYSEGNRAPVAVIAANKNVGAPPLTVQFSAGNSFDYDQDELTYEWIFTSDEEESNEVAPEFTFNKPGIYKPSLRVTDENGLSATREIEIRVGNEPPLVEVEIEGNKSFFWDNNSIKYNVIVEDKEDGSLANGTIDPSKIAVSFEYLSQGQDLAILEESNQASDNTYFRFLVGKNLIENSDCKACHAIDVSSIGPSYKEIAERYKGDESVIEFLATKIVAGGSGNWGKNMMAAHPQHTMEETTEMVNYILSIGEGKANAKTPLQGTFTTNEHIGGGEDGSYYITAFYTDSGNEFTGPLTGKQIIRLRNPKVQAETFNDSKEISVRRQDGTDLTVVNNIKDGNFISFNDIDLTNIGRLTFNLHTINAGGILEIRSGSPDGIPLGQTEVSGTGSKEISVDIQEATGVQDVYFVFKNNTEKRQTMFELDWIYFHQE